MRIEHRDDMATQQDVITLRVGHKEKFMILEPKILAAQVRQALALAVVDLIMARLGPAIEKALGVVRAEAEPAAGAPKQATNRRLGGF